MLRVWQPGPTRRHASAEAPRASAACSRPPSGLIAEDAFHTTTMDELAEAAGVSRATVFNRFGSKLGVLQALFTRGMEGPEMQAIQDALAIEDPVESLETMIEAACAIWEAYGFVDEQLQAIVVLEPDASALIERQRDGPARRPAGSGAATRARSPAPPGRGRGSGDRDPPRAHQPGDVPVAATRVRPLPRARRARRSPSWRERCSANQGGALADLQRVRTQSDAGPRFSSALHPPPDLDRLLGGLRLDLAEDVRVATDQLLGQARRRRCRGRRPPAPPAAGRGTRPGRAGRRAPRPAPRRRRRAPHPPPPGPPRPCGGRSSARPARGPRGIRGAGAG